MSKKRASELVCKRDAIDKEGESTQGVYVTTGQESYPYSVNCVLVFPVTKILYTRATKSLHV